MNITKVNYTDIKEDGKWAPPRLQGFVFGEMFRGKDERRGEWMREAQEIVDSGQDIELDSFSAEFERMERQAPEKVKQLVKLAKDKYQIDITFDEKS